MTNEKYYDVRLCGFSGVAACWLHDDLKNIEHKNIDKIWTSISKTQDSEKI